MTIHLNDAAIKHAKQLIAHGTVVTDSDWSDAQPTADEENQYIDRNGWNTYSDWFLGLDEDENESTKAHFAFPFGDFEKVHRSGVIAAKQRASQYGHAEVEAAADDLLKMIDKQHGA